MAKDNTPQLGRKNIKNLDAMVAAGMITQAQADKMKQKAMAKKKSLIKNDG